MNTKKTQFFDYCLDLKKIIFNSIYWSESSHNQNNFCENYFCKNDTTPYFLSEDALLNPNINAREIHYSVHDYCLKCDHMKLENEKYRDCYWFKGNYCPNACGYNNTCIFHRQSLCYSFSLDLYVKEMDEVHLSLIPLFLYYTPTVMLTVFLFSLMLPTSVLMAQIISCVILRQCTCKKRNSLALELFLMFSTCFFGILLSIIDIYIRNELFICVYIPLFFMVYLTKIMGISFIAQVTEDTKDEKIVRIKVNRPIILIASMILFLFFGAFNFLFSLLGLKNYVFRLFAGLSMIFVIFLIGSLEIAFYSFSFEFFSLLRKEFPHRLYFLCFLVFNGVVFGLFLISFLIIMTQNIAGLDSFSFEFYFIQYFIYVCYFFLQMTCNYFFLFIKSLRDEIIASNEEEMLEENEMSELEAETEPIEQETVKLYKGVDFENVKFSDTLFFFHEEKIKKIYQ
jgi:hypothetical protein